MISLHTISLVILFGISTCLTLALILWMAPWGNRRANQCLGLMLASSCAISAAFVPVIEAPSLPGAYYLVFSLQLLPAPLLYFYTRLLTRPDFRWRAQHAWHLVPALALALLWLLQQPLSPGGLLNLPCPGTGECDLMYRSRFVYRLSTYLSVTGYAIAVLRLLRPHLQRVKENYSAIEEVNLRWLRTVDYTFLLCAAAGIALELRGLFTPPGEVTPGLVQALSPLILSLLLGWFGLQQRRIQLGHAKPAAEEDAGGSADRKYQTSSLTGERAEAIWQKLQGVMANDKPYLEAGLKIADLARLLDVPAHHLSETINGFARQSFYEFINQHRVEEAARLLTDDSQRHLSVTDIGLQAGFNSNSTFFTHFKKRLQQTPRQYRQRHTNSLSA